MLNYFVISKATKVDAKFKIEHEHMLFIELYTL